MLEKPAYAPGCFGKVYCFAEDAICGACEFADRCKPARDRANVQLQSMYGVEAPKSKRSGLAVKPKQMFDELGKTEEQVREAMLAGQNPYRVKDGPVGIVAHLVLRLGVAKRSTLTRCVKEHRKLSDDTASVYTRYAIQILTHCGAVEVNGDAITLIRG